MMDADASAHYLVCLIENDPLQGRFVKLMQRDIDYAAVAVKTAITEKFGMNNDLHQLEVRANDRTISIEIDKHIAEGTRDDLLAALRKAATYDNFWEVLAREGRCPR